MRLIHGICSGILSKGSIHSSRLKAAAFAAETFHLLVGFDA
jgi:hypothetical protein